jgi:DNA-directed RNA polymerase subunit H (RpoH/RPB5)
MSFGNKSNIIADIYNSRNILLEQMALLDFNIMDNSEYSVHEVNSMFKNKQLDMLLEKNINENNKVNSSKVKVYIHYYLSKALRPANITDIVEELFNVEEILTKKDTLYIVTKDEPHDTLTNFVKKLWDEHGTYVVLQNIKRLQFNILNHVLVPNHRIIYSEIEKDNILKRYNITDNSQFPEISRFDPVIQVIGGRPGDIIEIIRPSKTSINSVYYRFCI